MNTKLRCLMTAACLSIPAAAYGADGADDEARPGDIIVTGTAQERYDFRDTGPITRTGTDLADLTVPALPSQSLEIEPMSKTAKKLKVST